MSTAAPGSRSSNSSPSSKSSLISVTSPDFTEFLPTEIIQQIFSYIGPETLESSLFVSKRWNVHTLRARLARGKRHVKICFNMTNTSTQDLNPGKPHIYWLWKNDAYPMVEEILRGLCYKYRLSEISSFEWSFDNSFEADIFKLLRADSPSILEMQFRISGYLDRVRHHDNQLKVLATQTLASEEPLLCGIIVRHRTTLL